MDNENEFELDGVLYVAREGGFNCYGCAFLDDDERCVESPSCRKSHGRMDGRNVIFVEKRP